MTSNFTVKLQFQLYSTAEKIDGCEYSLELIIEHLKEHMIKAKLFWK